MKVSPLPENEKERLAALYRYNILDTEAEKDFNDIVEMASQLCDAPISIISLIDEHRQWFKAKTGLAAEETHRDLAFCAHAIHQQDLMEVSDPLKDERFFDNPLVTGDPNIRFYAGMPLITHDGFTLGTLCVLDRKPRKLNEHQLIYLGMLAKKVVTLLELRLNISYLKEALQKNEQSNHFLDAVLENIPNMVFIKDAQDLRFIRVNAAGVSLLGYSQSELVDKTDYDFFPKEQADFFRAKDRAALNGNDILDIAEEPITTRGSNRLMHTKKISIRDKNGSPLYLLGISEDITERKKLEDQLKNFNEELKRQVEEKTHEVRNVFERISDAFVALDKNWLYTYVNSKAEQIFNRPTGYLIGKHIWTEFPEGVGHPFHNMYEEAMATQQYRYLEEYYPPYNRWFENHIYPSPTGLSIYFRDITEKKETELLVRNSEEKRRLIMNAALDAIICIDTKGTVTFWNPQAEKIFGWKEEEVMGRVLSEIIIPHKYREGHTKGIENFLKTGYGPRLNMLLELSAINRENKEFPIELTVLPIRQANEEFFCAFIRDITERKKAEIEIRNSEERYRSIFENSQDGIFRSTLEGKFITVNPAMAEIFGYESPHDMVNAITDIGTELYENPQDRLLILDLQKQHGRVKNFEVRVKKKNKEIIWVRENLHAVNDVLGKVQYLEGIMEDVTERKKAEELMVREKELSDSIINSLPGIFYLFDQSGKFLRWNKNLETISGYSGAEIATMHPLDFFDKDEKELLKERIGKVFTQGMAEVEANFLTKEGRKIPYYFNGRASSFENKVCLIGMGIDIIERKSAEAKLNQREARFRYLVENSYDAIVLRDKDFSLIYSSPSVGRILGYDQDRDFEKTLNETIHPQDIGKVKEVQQEVLNNPGKSVPMSFRKKHKDGHYVWVDGVVTNLLHIESVQGIISNFKDVTERKLAEEILLKEKKWSDDIINSLPGIFYLFDTAQNFLRWNKNFEIISGYSPEELKGIHALQFFADDEKEKVKETILRSIEKGVAETEALFITKSGRKIPYHFIGRFSNFEGLPCLIGVGTDISERKNAEEISRQAEAQYQSIFENALEGIYQTTPAGKFLTANPAMAKMLGYNSPLELRDSIVDIATQLYANSDERQRMIEQVERNGQVNGFEIQLRKKTNEIIWCQANDRAVKNSEGEVLYYEGTIEDITKHKLADERLQHQFEELKKINYELDHFVYSASHDLRAPLSSILGILNIAEMEKPSVPQKEYLGMIRHSINRLDGFIKDILDYSTNNRKEAQMVKIEFHEILDEVKKNLSTLSGFERLTFQTEISGQVPFYSDRTRVEIILSNLLSNAVKYQDFKKEKSTASLIMQTSERKVSIKLRDNGIGIQEVHLDKIFNMFYRASENSKGSGLGLYIVRETIAKLGGSIKVSSEFGQYTLFDIDIPNIKQ